MHQKISILAFLLLITFSLNAQDTEPNDFPEQAIPISFGDTMSGTISTTDLNDYYRIELEEGGLIQIDIQQQLPGGSYFYVYIVDGEDDTYPIINSVDFGWATPQATLYQKLLKGTYFIRVGSAYAPITYQFTTILHPPNWPEDLEYNNEADSALTMQIGDTLSGNIFYYGAGEGNDEQDWYRVEIEEAGYFQLYIQQKQPQGNWFNVYILDGESDAYPIIKTISFEWGYAEATQGQHLSSGTYYVKIANAGGPIDYRMIPSFFPSPWPTDLEPNNDTTTAFPMPLNDTLTGDLFYYDAGAGLDLEDWYQFEITHEGKMKLDIYKQNNSATFWVGLKDGNQDEAPVIAETYFEHGHTHRQIAQNLLPGKYYLQLYNFGNSFSYEIINTFIPKPIAAFEHMQVNNSVIFKNESQFSESYQWEFGDGQQSTAVNPFYEYENPSVYDVCLNVSNEIASDTYCEQVIVEGLASVYPNTAGNTGDATLTIYGGGLDSLSVIIIEKDGVPIEIQDTTFQISRDAIRGRLDLREQPLGLYDIAVETGAGNRYVLEDAFTIEEGTRPDPWVEVSGRNRILFNTPTTYTVRYGNNGNVDASVVYIWLAFSDVPDLEIEFTGVLFESPDLDIDSFVVQADLDPELLYISTDSVLGEPFQARVYPLIMPVIPANTVNEFNIKIKTPETLKIQSWTNEPIFQSSLNYEKTFDLDEDLSDFNFNALKCLSAIYTKTYIDEIPYLTNTEVNCIIQAHANNYLSLTTAVEKGLSPIASSSFNGKGIVSQLVFIVKTLKKCNVSLAEGDKREMADVVTQILLNELISIEGDSLLACLKPMCAASIIKPANQKNEQDCPQCGTFCANNIIENQVEAVSSLDPNEKDSPGGYTNKNYIKFRQTIPYTIHFENVDTADVPAHKVRVIDTLDAHKFDFTSFQFGSITIADTTVYPEKGHERLLMDVGLPHLDVVARIEANFDAQSGKLEWLFRSLDPVTLEEIEDPDVGFLPPNVSKPEGQGSVSFFIDLKDDLENEEEVLNDALIYFDANEAIETNVSSFTLDLGLPSSQVQALDYETYDTLIPLYWDGTDNESGVRFYDVYVSENQDTFYRWRTRTNQVFDYFIGEPGSTYRFFSIAVDSVGNEEVKEDWDAETNILVGTENIPQLVKCLTISPNPAKDDLSIQFYLEEAGDIQINISNLLGSHIKDIWRGRAMTGVNQFEAGLYGIPDGVYMVNVKVDGAIMSKKFVVMR